MRLAASGPDQIKKTDFGGRSSRESRNNDSLDVSARCVCLVKSGSDVTQTGGVEGVSWEWSPGLCPWPN